MAKILFAAVLGWMGTATAAQWTLSATGDNSKGLIGVTWLAEDGTTTSTTVNSEDDYVVAAGRIIYVSSAVSDNNVFPGHSLTIGDQVKGTSGTIFHYGGAPVTAANASFAGEGVILARGDWKTRYSDGRPYIVDGAVRVTATAASPFRFYRANTGGNATSGLRLNGPLSGSGYLSVGAVSATDCKGDNFVLYLAGGCADFEGVLNVISDEERRGALVVPASTCAGTFVIGAGSDLAPFAAGEVFSCGTLTAEAGALLKFVAQDDTTSGRTVTCSKYVVTSAFTAGQGVKVQVAFTDSANGKYSDSLDLLTVPATSVLDPSAFIFEATDAAHTTAAFSVRTDAAAQTQTLVLTFEGTGLEVLTQAEQGTIAKGLSGVTWSDGSTGTSADYNYAVLGYTLYVSSLENPALNVFNGNSLRIGDAISGTAGDLHHYGAGKKSIGGDGVLRFPGEGVVLGCGRWRTRYLDDYFVDGRITVKATPQNPFHIYDSYDDPSYVSSASLTWLGTLAGAGALQVEAGINNRATCTNFCLKILGDAADFTGSLVVTARQSTAGYDCHAGVAFTNGVVPASVTLGKNCYLVAPPPGERATLKALTMAENAEIHYVSLADAATGTRACGCVAVTDTFTQLSKVRLVLDSTFNGAAGGTYPLLVVPAATPLAVADFELDTHGEFLCRGATLTLKEDVVEGTKTLVCTIPEAAVVYHQAHDASVAVLPSDTQISSFTNAANWSDGAVPHAGAHYVCQATTGMRVLRTPANDLGTGVFPGLSLSVIGSASKYAAFVNLYDDFTLPVLRLGDNTFYHPKYTSTLHGEITVDHGLATIQVFGGGLFTHDGELTGAGELVLQGNGSGSGNPGGDVELTGINTNYAGRLRLTMTAGSNNNAPSAEVDAYGRRKFERLWLTDGRNVGGAMSPADPLGVVVDNFSQVLLRQSVTVDEPTRGWMIAGTGRFNVAEEQTLTFKSPLAVNGHFVKEGAGTLALGNATVTFGADGTAVDPDTDAANHTFEVVEGGVKPLTAGCLDGLDVVITNGATFVFAMNPADATLQREGVRNVKALTPFAVAGDTTALPVTFTGAVEQRFPFTNGLFTVTAAQAPTLRALLAGSRLRHDQSRVELVEVVDASAETVTFAAVFQGPKGMTISVR